MKRIAVWCGSLSVLQHACCLHHRLEVCGAIAYITYSASRQLPLATQVTMGATRAPRTRNKGSKWRAFGGVVCACPASVLQPAKGSSIVLHHNKQGTRQPCLYVYMLIPPHMFVHLCTLESINTVLWWYPLVHEHILPLPSLPSPPSAPGKGRVEDQKRLGLLPHEAYCMGGPGFVLSFTALKQLSPYMNVCLQAIEEHNLQDHEHLWMAEDVEFGRCMSRTLGVQCSLSKEVS